MKKLSCYLLILIAYSCIPYKIAPNIEGEKIIKAKKFKKEGLVPYSKQDKFKLKKLKEIDLYPGLPKINSTINWSELFQVFDIPVKKKAF